MCRRGTHLDQNARPHLRCGQRRARTRRYEPLHIPITATSAPLAGYISDTTGSYDGVFWLYGGCCALAAIGLTIMGSVLRSPDHQ